MIRRHFHKAGWAAAWLLAVAPIAGAAPPSGDYDLIWSDEFSGASLDRGLWSYRTSLSWDTAHRPENVAVEGGDLKLILENRPNDGLSHTTGGVVTNRGMRYGYFETRFKGWPAANWHTTFWTSHALGLETLASLPAQPHLGSSEAPRLELDFFEHDTKNTRLISNGLYRWGPQGKLSRGRKNIDTPDLSSAFHVFGGEVLPDRVNFFFDGTLVNSVAIDDFPQPDNFLYLTSIGRDIDDTNLPGNVRFDYFRYYAKRSAIPREYRLQNVAGGKFLRTENLGVLTGANLEVADDEAGIFRRDRWQKFESGGRVRWKNSFSSLALTGSGGPGSGHVVIVDFNDMNLGPMRQADGQPAGTGTGFGEDFWSANTGIPLVVAGDLTAPPATNYAAPSTGMPQCMAHASFADFRQQSRRTSQPMGGNVWFSLLLRSEEAGDRLGIAFNRGTGFASAGSSIQCVGDDLQISWIGGSRIVDGIFPPGQNRLLVGCLGLGAGTLNHDRLLVWIDPVLLPGESLGTPVFDRDITMLEGAASFIESLHLIGHGTATNSGKMDQVRLSDSPLELPLAGGAVGSQALLDVTGVAAWDETLATAAVKPRANTWDGANAGQEWEIDDLGGGACRLRHVASGLVLRADGAGATIPVTLGPADGSDAERWILREANATEVLFAGSSPLPDGWYGTWLGEVKSGNEPWVFHKQLGWIKVLEADENAVWFWHPAFGWLGARPADFPAVYQVERGAWGLFEIGADAARLWSGTNHVDTGVLSSSVDWQAVVEQADYSELAMTPGPVPDDPAMPVFPATLPPAPLGNGLPSLLGLGRNGNDFVFTVSLPVGSTAVLERSITLGNWQPAGIPIEANGKPFILKVPLSAGGSEFFRLSE